MTEKKYDVTALGELLIDFTENGSSSQGNVLMEANPGGAPCNVLAMLAKLGRQTAFIGKVGQDRFGRLLREVIESVGIDAGGLISDKEVHTTLAFVHTYPDGDRDFSFYRSPGADMMLRKEEVACDKSGNPGYSISAPCPLHTRGSGRLPYMQSDVQRRPGHGFHLTPISGNLCGTI